MAKKRGRKAPPAKKVAESPRRQFNRKSVHAVTKQQIAECEKAIQEFKAIPILCAKCGKVIEDIAFAINDKESGKPEHFDCALEVISKAEKVEAPEKIVYIGQGRFARVVFEDEKDTKHFSIKKIIPWDTDKNSSWKRTLMSLYSKVY